MLENGNEVLMQRAISVVNNNKNQLENIYRNIYDNREVAETKQLISKMDRIKWIIL